MFGKSGKSTVKKTPVSAHAAFPAVVALWFAALFGLGSLVLPVVLFEKLATATGLSSVVSAAAPPLGMTARLLIAGVAALLGVVAGVFIARKVASAQNDNTIERKTGPQRRGAGEDDLNQKRPISAREELGSGCLDEPIAEPNEPRGGYNGRRRALAVTDDSGPSEFLEMAPLPGGDFTIDAAEDATVREHGDIETASATLDLKEIGLIEEDVDQIEATEPELQVAPAGEDPIEVIETSTAPTNDAGNNHFPAPETSNNAAPELTLREELAAMTDRLTTPAQSAYNPLNQQQQPDAVENQSSGAPNEEISAAAQPTLDTAVTGKELVDMGVVELVERFALALKNKQNREAAKAAAVAEIPAVDAPYNPFGANIPDAEDIEPPVFRRSKPEVAEAAQSVEAAAGQPEAPQEIQPLPAFAQSALNSMPSSLQPLGFDDENDDDYADEADDLSLSLNVAPNRFARPNDAANAAAPAEESYRSLLAMKSPGSVGQEFVRVDAELDGPSPVNPSVVFPGQSSGADTATQVPVEPQSTMPRAFDAPQGVVSPARSTNNGETEQALRDALAKLQKMSGAA